MQEESKTTPSASVGRLAVFPTRYFRLDAEEIRSHPRLWSSVSPEEAALSGKAGIAVVESGHGFERAFWWDPADPEVLERIQSSEGSLRFYRRAVRPAAERMVHAPSPKSEKPAQWIPLEFLDAMGNRVAVASPNPVAKPPPVKTRPLEFKLQNAAGKACPPTSYRLTFPDGKVKEGQSDSEGFIRDPGNRQEGEVKLELFGSGKPRPETPGEILEVAWGEAQLLPWDAEDKPEMKVEVKVKTRDFPPCPDAAFEIWQFAADGSHALYRKVDGVKLEGDAWLGPDGKPLAAKISWHGSIYDYGKTQYFCKLKAHGKEKASGLDRASLLQLKHSDGIIADPSGDLPGAAEEGKWLAGFLRKDGPWLEATEGKVVADGHAAKMLGAVGNGAMKSLVENNKFLHHQSSHGTAYCLCDGKKNYFEDSGKAGPDGVHEWVCPVCKKSADGIGVIFLKDWSNLFFIEEVKKLVRAPKVLLLANCCLTAATSAYADAWIAQGTRWYIGWGIPVGDKEAVEFAKAFYRRWMVTHKMDPGAVKKAFNEVKAPYAQFRPRIFGS